jgi:hypothetical protein
VNQFLSKEGSFSAFFDQSLKLTHLMEISSNSIFLDSYLTRESSLEVVRFCCFLSNYKFFSIDYQLLGIDQQHELEKKFQEIMKNVIENIFSYEKIVIYWRITSDSIGDQENSIKEKFMQEKIVEIIHSLVTCSESHSIISEVKDRNINLLQDIKMYEKYPGLNTSQLFFVLSNLLKDKICFIICREPHPKKEFTLFRNYWNVFKKFNKFILDYQVLNSQSN